jgi:hypothetical protein
MPTSLLAPPAEPCLSPAFIAAKSSRSPALLRRVLSQKPGKQPFFQPLSALGVDAFPKQGGSVRSRAVSQFEPMEMRNA